MERISDSQQTRMVTAGSDRAPVHAHLASRVVRQLARPASNRNAIIGPAILLALLTMSARPASAIPTFAGRYGVACTACHSVPPRLNTFGMAFQANFFNFPGNPPPTGSWINRLPISALATASSVHNSSTGFNSTDFRTVEFLLGGGFHLTPQHAGGFFVDDTIINKAGPAGDLADAFVSLGALGPGGRLAFTIGQFTPMMYQFDPVNRLAQALPTALATGVDASSFIDPVPGIRADYFDHRGAGTADGAYASLGVPFQGHLSATSNAQVHGTRGVFGQAFRRWGMDSVGVFGYLHGSQHREGVLATRQVRPYINLTGIVSNGHDRLGGHQELSAEAEYIPQPFLAITGRLEALRGVESDFYPVGAVTYYPFHQHFVRLTAQATEGRGNHTTSLFVIGQL